MRILFVSNLYPPYYKGGYEIRCQIVAEQLESRGHTICVLTGDYQKSNSQKHLHRTLPYRPQRKHLSIIVNLQYEVRARDATRDIINSFRPDIIYVWNMWDIPITSVFTLESSEIPVIYQIDQNWLIESYDAWIHQWNAKSTWLKNVARSILKPILRRAGIATSHDDLTLDEIIFLANYRKTEHFTSSLPHNRVHTVYTGLPAPKTIREREDFTHLKMLFVSRYLTPAKGVITAVNAMKDLQDTRVNLDIYGEFHPDYEEYNAEIHELVETTDSIQLCGLMSYDEILHKYAHYDVLLFCSNHPEGMPLVIAEAMFAGLPVIGTEAGGAAEMLLPEASLTFDANDAKMLASRIQQVQSNDKLWKSLSEGAFRVAQEYFSLDDCITATEQILLNATTRENN